ncbi:acid phosphatase [Sphingomonas sp. ST-64]|uniref:Acid phosphatase n=1 Tax=Sphingomonas plantiphila TaxID=3163295 RepID=A0ABW8YRH5_9SPHN
MTRAGAIAALTAASLLTGGCAAAAIPVLAGGMIARGKSDGGDKPAEAAQQAVPRQSAQKAPEARAEDPPLATERAQAMMRSAEEGGVVPVEGMTAPGGVTAPEVADAPAAGAGEAAALSLQAYQTLWTHVAAQVAVRKAGGTPRSVVLAAGARLDAPRYVDCGTKSLAILFDLDENAEGSDPEARWRRWNGDGTDLVVAVPGAVEGVEAVRREGVQAIFTSARARSGAAGVSALIARLGLGDTVAGKTLFLRGGEPPISGDQMRRTIAASYCVIAIVGDSLGEFSDAFDAAGDAARRPTAATETMVAPLWGAGWFLLPNPVRSTAKSGSTR